MEGDTRELWLFMCFLSFHTCHRALLDEYGQYEYGRINPVWPLGAYSLVSETAIKVINIQINMFTCCSGYCEAKE